MNDHQWQVVPGANVEMEPDRYSIYSPFQLSSTQSSQQRKPIKLKTLTIQIEVRTKLSLLPRQPTKTTWQMEVIRSRCSWNQNPSLLKAWNCYCTLRAQKNAMILTVWLLKLSRARFCLTCVKQLNVELTRDELLC